MTADSSLKRFKLGTEVYAHVLITKVSNGQINVPKGDDFYELHLYRNGKEVPYLNTVQERIKERRFTITGVIPIKVGETKRDLIELSAWYGKLKVGQYKFSLRRLFWDARAVQTNTVSFKVIPPVNNSSGLVRYQTTDGMAYIYKPSGALLEETYLSGRKVRSTLNTNGDLPLVETQPIGSYLNWSEKKG